MIFPPETQTSQPAGGPEGIPGGPCRKSWNLDGIFINQFLNKDIFAFYNKFNVLNERYYEVLQRKLAF